MYLPSKIQVLGFRNSATLVHKQPEQFRLLGLSQFCDLLTHIPMHNNKLYIIYQSQTSIYIEGTKFLQTVYKEALFFLQNLAPLCHTEI